MEGRWQRDADGEIRNHAADGAVTESEMPTGATVYRDPMTHWMENIGTTTIRVLVVELKVSPGAPATGTPPSDEGVR